PYLLVKVDDPPLLLVLLLRVCVRPNAVRRARFRGRRLDFLTTLFERLEGSVTDSRGTLMERSPTEAILDGCPGRAVRGAAGPDVSRPELLVRSACGR
ncbi:MAG: hypothetical protein ACR2PA_16120, partial [Hyphomicrobiaceae bacterium]